MTRVRMIIFCALTISLAANLSADSKGFEGKWAIDEKKTPSLGDGPEKLQEEIQIEGPKLIIKSKYKEPENATYPLLWVGVMTYELELTCDGTERVVQIGPFAMNSKTVINGNTMTTEFSANHDSGGKVYGQWIRTLSADGKEIAMQMKVNESGGKSMDQTLYFKRK